MTELTEALQRFTDSETKVNLAVASANIKHLSENVNNLTNNVQDIHSRVSSNEKRLDTIESKEESKHKRQATFWAAFQKNWWRVFLLISMISGILIAEFDIVRQAVVK